jgi:hypothetical protein
MPDREPARVGELADLIGVVERLAGELALGEEPARFVAALEAGAPGAPAPAPDPRD